MHNKTHFVYYTYYQTLMNVWEFIDGTKKNQYRGAVL